MLTLVLVVILAALVFEFINGFHDTANSIATVVATKVLSPGWAVMLAAGMNLIGALTGTAVALTIANGLLNTSVVEVTPQVILCALLGGIVWNLITWWKGLPSSSSHALIGGLVGAAVAKAGTGALVGNGLLKTVVFIVVSPLLGLILGSLMMVIVGWTFFRTPPSRVDRWFRRLQLASASLYSLGHGGNDAQKTIGIIWMLLIASGHVAAGGEPPIWVIVSCYVAIGMGTLFGGWRIVRTMGQKITKLKPVGGFCAETGGAITLFIASALGVPVSTTHTITGAIVGVGSARKMSAVRWGVAGNIVWAWVLTIPASAFMSAIAWWIGRHIL